MNIWILTALMVSGALFGWLGGKTSLRLQQNHDTAATKIVGIISVSIASVVIFSAIAIGLALIFTGKRPDVWTIVLFFTINGAASALRRILRTALWGDCRPC